MKKRELVPMIPAEDLQKRIFSIRGVQVMLDSDLATLYKVETKMLNRAVRRNIDRFPESFRFQLSDEEFEHLRFQSGTSNVRGGRRYIPYVFTEQGVSMLSAILRSETAIEVSIQIINAFVEMRRFIQYNANIFSRLNSVERRQIIFESKTEQNFEKVFKALETSAPPKQGIFYDGQIFDAYTFVADLVRSAKKSIVLIDSYTDDSVLTLLSKRNKNVTAILYTKSISRQLDLDLKKYNEQYPTIRVHEFSGAHDRFLIIDESDIYHIGASLKDLGKKWFAFSRFEKGALEMLVKLEGRK